MKILTALRILVIVLAVIILVMLGVLFFYNPAKAPALMAADEGLSIATSSLQAGMHVQPPMMLQGSVTGGGWFFEGSFPIEIVDASGTVLGTTTAQAQGDWTSTGTVPWAATLRFSEPHTATGAVIFMSDNPSGISANQKMLGVPVRFQ